MSLLPYGRHSIEEDDIAAVAAVLRGDWLTTGPTVEAFETAFAAKVGARFAVACSSGTAGLHLAALALDLVPGDRAVVPAITFLATANAARYVGAEVSFTDVDPDTGLMEPEWDGPAAAVFPVHLAGQTADMPAIGARARARGLRVVEDACHAVGTTCGPEQEPVGSCRHSDMTVFSLHPVKTIAMGEGGVVTTNDESLDRRMRILRNHGMVKPGGADPWVYEMAELGFNYRASDIHCALGLSQLAKLDRFKGRRRALADRYDAALALLAPLVRPITRVPGCDPAWHLYPVLIDFAAAGTNRAAVMERLKERGIGTQVHYQPVHRQPYYRDRYGIRSLPGAESYYERELSLPLFPGMEDEDVARVAAALTTALSGKE